ncbi:GNAT family N-acetyltransferase [Roseobacter sp.]|uniref:GNAT family N-acetyltransferase n=1 Tax=Roseobacter sp. TaxID=1907202 RepID=UPI00329A4993
MTGGGASQTLQGDEPPEFDLRPARLDDFEFTRRLYIASMQPLLTALNAWNRDTIEAAFRSYFDLSEIKIVVVNGVDIGWQQVSITEDALCLDQLHLVPESRCRGIGTALIGAIVADARAQKKDVTLSFVNGNRAHALYRRLGFNTMSRDKTKTYMRLLTTQA